MNNTDLVEEFIEAYRKSRCLWDWNDVSYANRNVRNAAQTALLKIFKKYYRSANLASVRKKIDTLRTSYMREFKKVQASKISGSGEIYVPTLWYYNHLNFLTEVPNVARVRDGSLDSLGQPIPEEGRQVEECQQPGEDDADFQSPPPKNLKRKWMNGQKQLIAAAEKLANIPESGLKDNWEAYGLSVGGDLRNLERNQQSIAQKLISDVIYLAKMGRLSEGSTVVEASEVW